MKHFVKIVNRDAYTNPRKAMTYIERGLAVPVEVAENGRILSMRMLEAAELSLMKSHISRQRDPVTGHFAWHVGESGGSPVVREYSGVAGGMRGYQAKHGN